MKTVAKKRLYEGMFLVDSAQAGADWDGVISAIRTILEKAEAEIVSINKWDDRRLAYPIKGKTRGTYILSYFRVDGGRIGNIEKSVQLSERIMRVLILSAERLSQEDIEKDTPAMKIEKEKQRAAAEAKKKEESEQESAPVEAVKAVEPERVEQPAETHQSGGEGAPEPEKSEAEVGSAESMEKQPEAERIESSEPADEQEQR